MSRLPVEKRDHYSFNWFEENLSALSALAVHFGHTVASLDFSSAMLREMSLLNPVQDSFCRVDGDTSELVGAYAHRISITNQVIRSGSTVGQGTNFGVRNSAHSAGSKTGDSLFYKKFPSTQRLRIHEGLFVCNFEQLEQIVCVGFEYSKEDTVAALCSDYTQGGVLSWSPEKLASIEKASFSGAKTLREKQLRMAGYAFELLYDLMISPSANASQNPGFESCHGV
jgi:hypothetical protein